MLISKAIHSFKRAKQYYLTTVFTLALTLSMVLSVFTLVDLVFFAPLPYQDSENLYLLEGTIASSSVEDVATNSQVINHIKNNNDVFTQVATYHQWSDYKLYDQLNRPEAQVILASSNLFEVLGVNPALGRLFTRAEAEGNKQPSVILGYRIWQQDYRGDENIIGKKIQLNQRRFTVIGVAPDNLVLPHYHNINHALWIPLDMDETFNPKTFGGFMGSYKGIVRLTREAGIEQADRQIDRLSREGAEIYAPDLLQDFDIAAQLTLFRHALQGSSGNIVLMLLAGVILLLVIALINLSSMQLARAMAKIKSVAISFAFGANKKQLLMESFKHNIIVIGIAILLALLLTSISFSAITTLAADSIQRLDTLTISANTILFSALLALLIALLYSYIELSVVKEKNLTTSLQSSGKGVGKQMSTGTSHLLIGLQVVFSFIVLISASHVVLQTLAEALRDNGLNTEHKWSLTVNYANIKKSAERKNIHQALISQLVQLNKVLDIESASQPRLPNELNVNQLYDENKQYLVQTRLTGVSPGYFDALALAVHGQGFQKGDSELTNYPVIINRRLADIINSDHEQVLGRKVSLDGKRFHTIIGIVANTDVPGDTKFESYELFTPRLYSGQRQQSLLLTAGGNEQFAQEIRDLIGRLDSRLDIAQLTTLEQQFDEKRKRYLTAAWISIMLASVSLLMVCIGINGIVNYMVQIRRYGLGVKLSMGADNRRLLGESLSELMQPVLMGLFFAFSLSFFCISYGNTRPELHFSPNWPLIFAIWLGFCALSLLVSFFPVRKVLLSDPIKALRNE